MHMPAHLEADSWREEDESERNETQCAEESIKSDTLVLSTARSEAPFLFADRREMESAFSSDRNVLGKALQPAKRER